MKKILLFLVLIAFMQPIELNAQSGRVKRKKKTKKELVSSTLKKKKENLLEKISQAKMFLNPKRQNV
mgnify:CR=1 FL=1